MKKSLILAFACTLLMGNAAFAQTQQETTYVEDPAQGYLMNSFSDNWFITAEGGVGIYYMDDLRWHPDPSPLEAIRYEHCRRIVLAPSKIEVAFSYLF